MSAARQALLNVVNSEPLVEPGSQDKVPRQFVEDFEIVAAYYRLHELGEYEDAKETACSDIENAIVCYAALLASIRAEAPWRSMCGGGAMLGGLVSNASRTRMHGATTPV